MTAAVVDKRASSFKPNANQRYVGRGSLFGNPFTHWPLTGPRTWTSNVSKGISTWD